MNTKDRKMLARDLDGWRNLVEYLMFHSITNKGNKAMMELDKAVQAYLFACTDTSEHHTRH